MLERWVRGVIRFRGLVLACWVAVVAAGVGAATRLPALLANSFAVPGTDSDRARAILEARFGQRPDGVFTVVFRTRHAERSAVRPALHRRLVRAARALPTGHAEALRAGAGVLYGDVATRLDLQHAKRYTDAVRHASRSSRGPPALVTGQPAIQHDLDPIFASDLRRGEAIALPLALAVLLAVLGLSPAVLVPFAFALCTITGTLAAVYALAHVLPMVTYVTNLVELIGLGLAVDYSLLIVHRFREEAARGGAGEDAIVRTMATAGRAVVFSGVAVAIGLALLLLVPVPFVRSMGVAGVLIPLVSVGGALTLQPVLLSMLGPRATARLPVAGLVRARLRIPLPALPGTREPGRGLWPRLARTIMRRPLPFLAGGTAVLVAAAVPALSLRLTPGSISGIPRVESVRGYELLRRRVGPGAVTPTEVVVDAGAPGAARSRAVRAAVDRLADGLLHDPEAYVIVTGRSSPFVDASGRYGRLLVVGRHEYGDVASRDFVRRLRGRLVPAARLPHGTRVYVGGVPAQGSDFLDRTYGAAPWLAAGVLALTYVLLLRAFRSLLLPLKAVLLNLLTVAAVYGLLVVVFRWGVGAGVLGVARRSEIDGWVPVFLFATLFGLSMDYEVFLVSRMRESWDEVHENGRAVAHGLERTGRVVTAAALIMAAAFSGFVVGRIPALQEFGLALAAAVLLDATLVRAVLVPSFMAVVGRWNWWLPRRAARLARVEPSELA